MLVTPSMQVKVPIDVKASEVPRLVVKASWLALIKLNQFEGTLGLFFITDVARTKRRSTDPHVTNIATRNRGMIVVEYHSVHASQRPAYAARGLIEGHVTAELVNSALRLCRALASVTSSASVDTHCSIKVEQLHLLSLSLRCKPTLTEMRWRDLAAENKLLQGRRLLWSR